jgi:sensor histidine kinase regulating citrate/malate metabolism
MISAVADEKGSQVKVNFENEGGMLDEIREAAVSGRLERRGRKSSGVFIASLLIKMQGGTFDIESDEKGWTRVSVSLPLSQTEEEDYGT